MIEFVPLKEEFCSRNKRTSYRELLYNLNPTCTYCGNSVRWSRSSLDHVVPISKGGEDCQSNTVLCCNRCNEAKNNRSLEEWINDLIAVKEWLEENRSVQDRIERLLV